VTVDNQQQEGAENHFKKGEKSLKGRGRGKFQRHYLRETELDSFSSIAGSQFDRGETGG